MSTLPTINVIFSPKTIINVNSATQRNQARNPSLQIPLSMCKYMNYEPSEIIKKEDKTP